MSVPTYLAADQYPAIEIYMTTGDIAAPSAAQLIGPEDNPAPASYYEPFPYDFSFSRQLNQLVVAPETIDRSLVTPPDVYLVTANSAIPIADAIRGFYEELGIAVPIIAAIAVNGYESAGYFDNRPLSLRHDRSEIKRLKKLIDGMAHVCVVDQYISSGKTVTHAAHIALAAGAQSVSAAKGKWYEQASRTEINFKTLSSIHADFMRTVGRTSCAHQVSLSNY